MRRVVIDSDLHEQQIRPKPVFTEFRRQSIEDAREFFGDPDALVEVACPACDANAATSAFDKDGFHYKQCTECDSVYVSPRPTADALAAYFSNSKASAYRVEHFQRETAEARRNHLTRAHVNWLARTVDEQGNPAARAYIDVGTNSPVIFDEVARLELFDSLSTLDPLPGLTKDLAGLGVSTNPPSNAGAITSFQQLEHQFSPYESLCALRDRLAPKGILGLMTRTISGFDLQVLWDKAPYIFVPEHLNLLSIVGLQTLINRAGLDLFELSTPGQLDLELTAQAAENDPDIELPSFVRNLLAQNELAQRDFQAYLQKHRLSSHVRIAAIKNPE